MSALRCRRPKIREHGFALAGALLAVVLIGALVAGVFFATVEETTVGSAFRARGLALNAAESALETTLSGTALARADSLPVGSPYSITGAIANVYVTRLDSSLYWLVAESQSGADGTRARRRIGLTVKVTADSSNAPVVVRIPGQAWVELF